MRSPTKKRFMNEQDVKKLKDQLKDQTKNELVKMVLKAATAIELYRSISEVLKEKNEKLEAELKVFKANIG